MDGQCVVPGCDRRRNGTGLRCSRHSQPGDDIMADVLEVLARKPRARLSEIAERAHISKSTAMRALWALEDGYAPQAAKYSAR